MDELETLDTLVNEAAEQEAASSPGPAPAMPELTPANGTLGAALVTLTTALLGGNEDALIPLCVVAAALAVLELGTRWARNKYGR